jgi:Niemann-Pick C1 protein
VTLADVCLRPMGLGTPCAVQSFGQYWGMSREAWAQGDPTTGVKLSTAYCLDHWTTQCLADYGAPVDPKVVLGGFPGDPGRPVDYAKESTALVVTLPLLAEEAGRVAAEAWEAAFIRWAEEGLTEAAEAAGLGVAFSAERSVADELAREGTADAPAVALSYLMMTAYVAIALGRFPREASWRSLLARGRAGLGLAGVSFVAASVAGAFGLCGWAGIGATLIASEALPFLALAIGVDNLFIIASAALDEPRLLPPAERVGRALGATGPSITLAAACEVAAFALGGLTSMPAVRSFSLCAAFAVALDYILQVTALPSVLAMDLRRSDLGRPDCLPCLGGERRPFYDSDSEDGSGDLAEGEVSGRDREYSSAEDGDNGDEPLLGGRLRSGSEMGVTPALRWYMREMHAPMLRKSWVKAVVIAVFGGLFFASCAAVHRMEW